ncbi:hypothetical protein NEOC95_002373 [Neochlamydia sp. AcF95]|nr:hypothetical protein [Neochlamydia sp. AcF95]
MLSALKECADVAGMINWERLAIDGFFFRGKVRR